MIQGCWADILSEIREPAMQVIRLISAFALAFCLTGCSANQPPRTTPKNSDPVDVRQTVKLVESPTTQTKNGWMIISESKHRELRGRLVGVRRPTSGPIRSPLVFDNVPLAEVIQRIEGGTRDRNMVPIRAEWDALEREGVSKTMPISFRVENPTVGTTLDALMQIIESATKVKLALRLDVSNHVILTTLSDHLTQDGLIREYDVSAFTEYTFDEKGRDEAAMSITRLVKESLPDLSWDHPAVRIAVVKNRLIVRQPIENQKAVEDLVAQIMETHANDLAVPVRRIP
jgi:hypothetical protein